MQILFIISILCFLVLVWAGIAIARHIHLGHKRGATSTSSQTSFAQHLITAVEDGATRSPRPVPQQTVKDVAARKSWNSSPAPVQIKPAHDSDTPSPMQGKRKSPQASHYDAPERLDWEYFNKDAGDLTDPYQPQRLRANSGINATSPKRF
jgi:hypothetical protein